MKDIETQNRFVELRAKGWSFTRIAEELKVSKPTLIAWSRKFQYEIQNLRAIELESLQEMALATRESRIRALGEELRRVEEELKTRSLADLTTSQLYSLAGTLRQQIQREIGSLKFSIPVKDIPNDEYQEAVQEWKP